MIMLRRLAGIVAIVCLLCMINAYTSGHEFFFWFFLSGVIILSIIALGWVQ